jgi:hypothetical protein
MIAQVCPVGAVKPRVCEPADAAVCRAPYMVYAPDTNEYTSSVADDR